MNDRQLEKKIRRDASQIQDDVADLVGESAATIGKIEGNLGQAAVKAKETLSTWVGESANQIAQGVEKITLDTRNTLSAAGETVKKDVGLGLNQYNKKAQVLAEKLPGGFNQKVAQYPWVSLTVALVLGLLLGVFLTPVRRSFAQSKLHTFS